MTVFALQSASYSLWFTIDVIAVTLADHLSYGYTETPWTTTIQQGSFDM